MKTGLLKLAVRASVMAIACMAVPGVQAQAQAVADATPKVKVSATPIGHFYANRVFSSASLSPNARFLAVRFGADKQRYRLAVVDLVANKIKVVAAMSYADVASFHWINDNRLIYTTSDTRLAPGKKRHAPGLFAINKDGTDLRELISTGGETSDARTLSPNHQFVGDTGAQNSDSIYIYKGNSAREGEYAPPTLLKLDTKTGLTESVRRPPNSGSWLLDYKGEPRLTVATKDDVSTVVMLEANGEWRTLASFNPYLGGDGAFTPLDFGPDGTMYVSSNRGGDKQALYSFDLKTNKLSDAPLLALEDYDFSGNLVFNDKKLIGINYLSDASATAWLDPAMKAMQDKVDALLPNTVNRISVARRAEIPWVLVMSYSDRQPGKFNLYNTETGKLNFVGDSMPHLNIAEMAEQEAVRVKARDGLVVPAWLTLPNASRKNLPMVVLVHGGPYVRGGSWGWNRDAQFLASRGYAVIEPEFRGSTGFGTKHYKAGWKQWGLAMQNDIADVTKWAIAQGIADPKRICIAGASYGGYATLMGLVNDPDLFKCGVNWVGVTDLDLLAGGHWSGVSDLGTGYLKYGMPVLIGDPVKDAEQFKKTSPIHQAARITQPLLLAYGALDVRVPLYHGKKFREAVEAHNKNVEMIIYDDEGHGWSVPENHVDFWGKVEKFLDQHIGKP